MASKHLFSKAHNDFYNHHLNGLTYFRIFSYSALHGPAYIPSCSEKKRIKPLMNARGLYHTIIVERDHLCTGLRPVASVLRCNSSLIRQYLNFFVVSAVLMVCSDPFLNLQLHCVCSITAIEYVVKVY